MDLPPFDDRGLLPPGDYPLTLEGLRRSALVVGPGAGAGWDRGHRARLVDALEGRLRQLWRVGIVEIYLGGSFVSAAHRPEDLDGYFVCSAAAFHSEGLHRALNALDPHREWTWRREDRRPGPDGRPRLPMWHRHRVELFPYYGQPGTGVRAVDGRELDYPRLFRSARPDDAPRGVVRLLPELDLGPMTFDVVAGATTRPV